jgi:hypothetical protein
VTCDPCGPVVTVSWWAAADEPHSSGLAAGMQLPDPADPSRVVSDS